MYKEGSRTGVLFLTLLLLAFLLGTAVAEDAADTLRDDSLFFLNDNGVTVMCPGAPVGSMGRVDGVMYTKRDETQLREIIASGEQQWPLLETSCTSGVKNMGGLFWNCIPDQYDYDRKAVFTCSSKFYDKAINGFNQDISNWDTSNVLNMYPKK